MAKENEHTSFLVINPFGIGDCLFSTPLISLLHHHFPSAKIYFLCNKKTYPVMQNHPLIEKAFIYERDDFVQLWKRSFFQWFVKYAAFLSDIRREHIKVCLDLSLNTQYGFYAWAAGIHRRFGLDYKNRCFFLNKKIAITGFNDKPVADYYLDAAKFLGVPVTRYPMSIGIGAEDKSWAAEWFARHSIAGFPLNIGIAPCGGDSFGKNAHMKRWPAEYFSALIIRLRKTYNAAIFIFAGPKESADVDAILRGAGETTGIFNFSSVTLGQTMALISDVALLIGNDTGALRFADALSKKVVAIVGPVDERVYGLYPADPLRTAVMKKDMACRPCYRNFRLPQCENNRACLRGISVDEVFAAAETLLRSERRRL